MLSQSVQDYLKTIYKLQESTSAVSTTQIAKELDISGASVTGMLKRLAAMKLVDYNSYKGVRLTEDGTKVALEILRHHRLLELYLKESLGFSLAKVHDEACRLEHYVSDEFVERIDDLLGRPEYSPLGNPIPTKEGRIPESSYLPVTDAELNKQYIIKRIADDNHEMVAYFEEVGLIPGVDIMVLSKAPFNGPLTIKYSGKEYIVGNEVGRNIYVDAI
ncbi:MAG: metal-dependent transcriptional regulator [Desulfobulbaceae bacterium]|nr:metal-dependent transcriptional regulator [Candidatus Kapabacteria bacterium]MBS4000900.1 metal-dependent transcriptional regulator [Desulfobulbaceae bacterium]